MCSLVFAECRDMTLDRLIDLNNLTSVITLRLAGETASLTNGQAGLLSRIRELPDSLRSIQNRSR